MNAIFTSADKDGDGLLVEHEYLDFEDKWMMIDRNKYGCTYEFTHDDIVLRFNLKDRLTPEADGVSLYDLREKWLPLLRELFAEIQAEK